MNNTKNYTLKIFRNGREVDKVGTHSVRKILTHLRSINWENDTSTYIRVSYGKKKDGSGKPSTFYNDGNYCNEQDLLWAFNVFNEED